MPGQQMFIKQIKSMYGNTMETINIGKQFAHGNYQLDISGPGGIRFNKAIIN